MKVWWTFLSTAAISPIVFITNICLNDYPRFRYQIIVVEDYVQWSQILLLDTRNISLSFVATLWDSICSAIWRHIAALLRSDNAGRGTANILWQFNIERGDKSSHNLMTCVAAIQFWWSMNYGIGWVNVGHQIPIHCSLLSNWRFSAEENIANHYTMWQKRVMFDDIWLQDVQRCSISSNDDDVLHLDWESCERACSAHKSHWKILKSAEMTV